MPSAAVRVRRARSRSPPGRFDFARRTRPRLEEEIKPRPLPSATVHVRRARSRSPPGGFDSARRTRPRLEEIKPSPWAFRPMPSSTVCVRRARSCSPPGFDSARRTQPRLEEIKPRPMSSATVRVRRKRSRSPPGGFDSERRTRPRLEEEMKPNPWAFSPITSSMVRVRRASSCSPAGGFDSERRTRPRLEEVACCAGKEEDGMIAESVSALPDDVLLEVFKLLPPPTGVVRCAAVCRRWCRVVSGAECLPTPPRHFGFFRNYGPSPLPPFVPAAGVGLDLGFLPVSPACGVILLDRRGHRLLMRELGAGSEKELRLLVCNPLERTFVRLPFLPVAGHTMGCSAVVPGEGAAFRVVVALFGAASPNFYILIYSSVSSAWEVARGALKRPLIPHPGPSVVVGDVVYTLQCQHKFILGVNMTKMTLSMVRVPDVQMSLYTGNCWIGTTEDGRLCFFAIRNQLLLVKWVLEAPGKWAEQEPVALRQFMNVDMVGDLVGMKLSAKISDQLDGCKLVSFSGFCEGSGTLFFVMADCVVALDLKTSKMERLWRNDDESRPLGDVFPYEMVAWPPVLKDFSSVAR